MKFAEKCEWCWNPTIDGIHRRCAKQRELYQSGGIMQTCNP